MNRSDDSISLSMEGAGRSLRVMYYKLQITFCCVYILMVVKYDFVYTGSPVAVSIFNYCATVEILDWHVVVTIGELTAH